MSNTFNNKKNNFVNNQSSQEKKLNHLNKKDEAPVVITPLRRSSRRYNFDVDSYPPVNNKKVNKHYYNSNAENQQFNNQRFNNNNNNNNNQNYYQQNKQNDQYYMGMRQPNNPNNAWQNSSPRRMSNIPKATVNNAPPQQEQKSTKKSNKPKKGFLTNYSLKHKIILGICVVAIFFSSAKLIEYAHNSLKQKKAIEEAQELYSNNETTIDIADIYENDNNTNNNLELETQNIVVTPAPTKSNKAFVQTTMVPYLIGGTRSIPTKYVSNAYNRVNEKFFSLLDINKDIVGWIKMGDFLDQPVMLKNNVYYLTHNYKKEKNPAGAIFIDESCSIQSPPENLILHGHNMKDGSMFAKLLQFKIDKGISFYVNNAIFTFDSLYQNSQYVIFSVFEAETNYKSSNYFPFVAYSKFNNDTMMLDFVRNVKSRSLYSVPIEVLPSDSLMTLATCTRTTNSSRLIVVARRIRDDENIHDIKDVVLQVKRIR